MILEKPESRKNVVLISILGVLLVITSVLFAAQYSFKDDKGTIKGNVVDAVTGEAIPYANVKVFHNDSLVKNTITDLEGHFAFELNPGTYDVKVSYIGMDDLMIKKVIVLSNEITSLDLKMKEKTLKEVEIIEYEEPLIEKDNSTTGTLTEEAIKKAPTRSESKSHVSIKSSRAYSKMKSYSEETIYDKRPARVSNEITHAGVLTAGEINDFSKWELWQDVSSIGLDAFNSHWNFNLKDRFAVLVKNKSGMPVVDCEVQLLKKDQIIWTARTDNTGKAELWANIYEKGTSKNLSIKAVNRNNTKTVTARPFRKGLNILEIENPCDMPGEMDALFVVDATGSMGDEISYLKSELNNVIERAQQVHPELHINLGSVFYRDIGDEYITRSSPFSDEVKKTTEFIKSQYAAGGGDGPEAVDSALVVAINNFKWSDKARARLLFLVLDAPPHQTTGIVKTLQSTIRKAASLGIRIIPITGSGIDKSAEYLYRSFALATNGTYVFLTDHSGVGNPHLTPTTDAYDVELLNDLLVRLIDQYTVVPSCSQEIIKMPDTMFVKKVIDHVIVDSSLIVQYNIDYNHPMLDSEQQKRDSVVLDSSQVNHVNKDDFRAFKYFPNPTKRYLNVIIDGKIDEIFLADFSGKILQKITAESARKLTLDLSNYTAGTYFLRCFDGTEWFTGKVVLVH